MIDIARYARAFPSLTFSCPSDHVLQLTLAGLGLNNVDAAKHAHLADVWTMMRRRGTTC